MILRMKTKAIGKGIRQTFINPVSVKELRARMRGKRAFVILTIYLLILSAIVTMIYAGISLRNQYGSGVEAGTAVFTAALIAQGFIAMLIAPVFSSGAISGEKERQTYDILRVTLLPASGLVTGKLVASIGGVLLVIFASIPVQSIAFMLGGISFGELLMSQIVLAISAITFSLIGLYFSAHLRSTASSTILALAIVFGSIILGPLLIIFSDIFGFSLFSQFDEELFLASTNMAFSLINVSGSSLSSDRAAAFIVYCLLYAGIALLLYRGTIRRVRGKSDQQPTPIKL